MRPVLASLALAGVALACGGEEPVSRGIAASVERGPGTRLVLAEHTGFAWDRVCVFGPYTPDARVDALTGVRGAAGRAHDIRSRDGINVLMFITQDRIARSIAHPRSKGDFGPEVIDACYPKGQAIFSVRVPGAGSWGTIGPE